MKKVIAILCVAAFLLSFMPATAFAAADNTGYLMWADNAWSLQYWADPVDTGIVPTDVNITGPGQYTVGLDFTGTANGSCPDLVFTAIGIKAGEINFPGYFIEIDSIKVNGEDVAFTKNYTSSDDEKETRSNIYNSWVTSIPEDAHTLDGDVSNVSPTIVDPAAFTNVETVYVTFTFYDADGNDGSAAEEPADDAATTDVPKTGVVGLGLVYGLGALATGAFVLKRKNK